MFDWNQVWDALATKVGENYKYRLDLLYITEEAVFVSNNAAMYTVANTASFKPGFYATNGDFLNERSSYPDVNSVISKGMKYLTASNEINIQDLLSAIQQVPAEYDYISFGEGLNTEMGAISGEMIAAGVSADEYEKLIGVWKARILIEALEFLLLFGQPTCILAASTSHYDNPMVLSLLDGTCSIWLAQIIFRPIKDKN